MNGANPVSIGVRVVEGPNTYRNNIKKTNHNHRYPPPLPYSSHVTSPPPPRIKNTRSGFMRSPVRGSRLVVPPDDDDGDGDGDGSSSSESPKISKSAMSKRFADIRGKKFDTRRAAFR